MQITLDPTGKNSLEADAKVLTAYQRTRTSTVKGKATTSTVVAVDHWADKGLAEEFKGLRAAKIFKAGKDEVITFSGPMGETVKVVGLGDKTKLRAEDVRRSIARIFKTLRAEKHTSIAIDLGGFDVVRDTALSAQLVSEALQMSAYTFDRHQSKKSPNSVQSVWLFGYEKRKEAAVKKGLELANPVASAITLVRDLVNEAPNFLTSEEYARRIDADVKANLKGVKVKILNKAQIKAEKMGLLLSVNAGSAFEPRLVHLTYEPARKTAKTKHIALVGKGITFDTGGYCIKPGTAMAGMKTDMGGSATVYGAFRAAVQMKAQVKITCILAITDNAINAEATFPDAIITGRNGKTVEILNTDAEGRLILADALDYACDQKPDAIVDAATLTGACLVALGNQVAAVLGNDQKWIDTLLKAAKESDEYMWQLPIIDEWRSDIKSKVADLKNIGTPMRAGTAIGAAFLEEFVKDGISWAHLDVAGVVDGQSHLPYCPPHGASGVMVRTLVRMLMTAK